MISIQAAQAGIGDRVRYRPPDPSQPVREGTIKNVIGRLVLVRFQGDEHSTYTKPDYLEWVAPH